MTEQEAEKNDAEKDAEEGDNSSAANENKENTGSSNSNKNNSSNKNSSSNSGSGNKNNTPSHTHVWQDHIAARQVWIENWVTVPDYETRTIHGAQLYTEHSDGNWYSDGAIYWFYTDADRAAFKDLIYNMMKNEGYMGNYVNRTKTEQVQVGSHQEDQGYYETQTYVDYQYCSCGATK